MRLRRSLLLAVTAAAFTACAERATTAPPDVGRDTTLSNLSYGADRRQRLDLSLPAGRTASTPLVLIVHGGGWVEGDKRDLAFLMQGLRQRGFAAATMNYRLAPRSGDVLATQLDDIGAALALLARRAEEFTYSGTRVYLAGHSAGGQLVLTYANARNADGRIRAVSAIAAPTDLYGLVVTNPFPNDWQAVVLPLLSTPLQPITPTSEARYRSASPISTATATSPPTILFHGDTDLRVPFTQSTDYGLRLGALGVDVRFVLYGPQIGHAWWGDVARTLDMMDQMAQWYTAHP